MYNKKPQERPKKGVNNMRKYGFVETETKQEVKSVKTQEDVDLFSDLYDEAKLDIDFELIVKVMNYMDWRYADNEVITKEKLIQHLDYLFVNAVKEFVAVSADVSLSVGGFEMVLREIGELEILFVLEDVIISAEDLENGQK